MGSTYTPKVSIIICVLNGRRYLGEVEDYLAKQSFKDCEILFVVSDASTDGSQEEICNYCEKHPESRIIIQKESSYLGGAKNIGIKHSCGDYLWFMDIDDLPSPDYLKVMVRSKEDTDSDVAICNFRYTDIRKTPETNQGELILLTGSQALHARSLNIIPVASWSMLYDRRQITETGILFDESMSEDIGFTYKILNASDKVCYYTAPLYGYYLNNLSFCGNTNDFRGKTELESCLALSDYFPSENSYLQKRFCLLMIRSLCHMTRDGFVSTVGDSRLRTLCMKYLTARDKLEYIWATRLPKFYYFSSRVFFKHFYYKPGNNYSSKCKIKTLKKIAEKH